MKCDQPLNVNHTYNKIVTELEKYSITYPHHISHTLNSEYRNRLDYFTISEIYLILFFAYEPYNRQVFTIYYLGYDRLYVKYEKPQKFRT